ncbi:MAG: S41 family peptidase [Defluviitaleaceae bacterium]|nr:S41 family peptidase [Defluviitaleaceae bacterium]
MDNKKSFAIGLATGIILMFICIFGYNVYDRHVRWEGRLDPNRKISEIYSLLNEVSIIPIDKAEMLENMYRGFLDGVGDPYTQYFDRIALEAFRLRTEGDFVGIGVQAMMDTESGNVTIINPFRDSPAANAGILPGDQIVGVDGVDMTGRSTEEVFNRIRGPEGSPVVLTIVRPYEDKRFDVSIVRAQQVIPTVFHEMMPGNIGYIRIEGFNLNTRPQFREAMEDLTSQGKTALVLDVRNNPGGVLDVVRYIANYFVPEGVITYVIDAQGRRMDHNAEPGHLGIPLAVLINGRSASASELLAGAIRDSGVGVLVGEQTFGKGIVQHLYTLSDGSAVKTTVAEYFPPSGTPIHMVGVPPDIFVEMEESLSRMIGHLEITEDVQLMAALRILAD